MAGLLEPPLWGGGAPGPIGTPGVLAEHGCGQSHPSESPVGATTLESPWGFPVGRSPPAVPLGQLHGAPCRLQMREPQHRAELGGDKIYIVITTDL